MSTEAILMSTHNICFYGEIMKMIPKLFTNTLLICFTGLIWVYTVCADLSVQKLWMTTVITLIFDARKTLLVTLY